MSGIMQSSASGILRDLLDAVKQCQIRFGSRTELATDSDPSVARLCTILDSSFSHGLKSNGSLLRNVTDLVFSSTGSTNSGSDTFWEFAFPNMTSHEKERFNTLRYVGTDWGKGRALIRAALNERSLERYILVWLNAPNREHCYESWSLMREAESANLLPSIAAGLSTILFAVKVDYTELNLQPTGPIKERQTEPIIAAPRPSMSKSTAAHKRHLVSFEDAAEESSSISSLSSATSAPKSLSSMCLKFPDSVAAVSNFGPEPSYPEKVASPPPSVLHSRLSSVTVDPELPSLIQYDSDFKTSVTTNNTSSSGELDTTQDDSVDVLPNDFDANDVFAIEEDFGENLPDETTTTTTSETTSTRSTTSNSMPKERMEDVDKLRNQLGHMVERCSYLENQMAVLSLENHRLRSLARGPNGLTYFSVSVPRVLMQNTGGSRRHYTYQVHIIPSHGGDEWTVLRRYNEFYKLHRKYQKDNIAVKTLDFPPKKRFGNMDAHFVEQRRQRLQVYLRHLMAVVPEVAQCTTRAQLESAFTFLA